MEAIYNSKWSVRELNKAPLYQRPQRLIYSSDYYFWVSLTNWVIDVKLILWMVLGSILKLIPIQVEVLCYNNKCEAKIYSKNSRNGCL